MKSTAEKKQILFEIIARVLKTYERKESYLKEIADDKATLEFLIGKETAGESMPDYSNYTDYAEWKDTVQKEIVKAETTIENLETRMVEVEAFQYYIENYVDTGE